MWHTRLLPWWPGAALAALLWCACPPGVAGAQEPAWQQLYDQGRGLMQSGAREAALAKLEAARQAAEQALGTAHPMVATVLDPLAALYQAQGRFPEAEQLLQRCRDIWEQHEGAGSPHVADSAHHLARLYHALGREADAEALLRQVIAFRQIEYGVYHQDLAAALADLAAVYHAQGRLPAAEPLLLRAVAIRDWHRHTAPLAYARALNALAAHYHVRERYAEALRVTEQALAVDRDILGERHPDVATDLTNVAVLYQSLGRLDEAKAAYRRAITAWKMTVDPLDPALKETLADYAVLLRQRGDTLEADVFEGMARPATP